MLDNEQMVKQMVNEIETRNPVTIDDVTLRRSEQQFVTMAASRRIQRAEQKSRYIGIAAAAIAIAFLASLWMLHRAPTELPFTVNNGQTLAEVGRWIETGARETEQIQFRQGSRFVVGTTSAARVATANKETVALELSSGSVQAAVRGNGKTQWKINAGPFTVTVLGTQFDVHWQPSDSRIHVKVNRGIVLVQGGGLNAHGVRLEAGQQLDAQGHSGEVTVKPVKLPETAEASQASTTETEVPIASNGEADEVNVPPVSEPTKTKTMRSRKKTSVDWTSYYRDGAFSTAVDAARNKGLTAIYNTASPQELWSLADAARHTGEVQISNDALIALRRRAPNTPKARLAAFMVGKSVMDKLHRPDVAAKWFNVYLREAPHGPMAEETYGRLMRVYQTTGQNTLAKQVAHAYTQQFPTGLYTERATRVLKK